MLQRLTNKTGSASVKGTIVAVYYTAAAVDSAFKLVDAGSTAAIGVVYEDGTATTIGTTDTATITATSSGTATRLRNTYLFSSPYTLLATDRIVVRVVFNNSSASSRTAHLIYQGTTRAAYIETTLLD